MKQIIKSQFVTDVTETKMTRKELATKYELPETEIKKIMARFGLKISRKQHATYTIVDDTVASDAVDIIPESVELPQTVDSESHVN